MLPKSFVPSVIAWFRENRRELPWRIEKDPYQIWISEVMLQQTRIEAVIPYYHRFLETLPTLSDLAHCPDEKLMKLWEGLGYYSRARNLKKAANMILDSFDGAIPSDTKELQTLPGIGEYTAGAIASIAFGKPAPAVDGNVLRVLTRILADKRDIALPATKKELTELLRSEYPEGEEASLLTEGIMEIGERVCIPNGVPLCSSCPLFDICLARKKGLTDQIPVKSPKAERKLVKMTVFILEHDGKFALRKRSNEGLLSGMWEFYHTEKNLSQKEALAHLKESGFCPTEIRSLGSEHHIFTHLEWKMKGYFAHVENRGNLIWKTKEELEQEIALPGAFHKWKQKMKEGTL